MNDARLPDIGFESYDSMEGLIAIDRSAPPARFGSWPGAKLIHAVYPGLLVAGTIALASTWLAQHYTAPVMLFALLFGMAFHFLHEEGRCVAGIEFASRSVLRLGVGLLGVRITLSQIASLGPWPVATVIVGVATTILFGFLLARRMGLSSMFGVLSGGAVAICGASAALAIASVLPRSDTRERDTILTVVSVTALSTIAMIIYPIFATSIGLDHRQAGIFIGGTIHDVAQVVGAGYTISNETGDIATYVKLLRVAMLLPAVFAISFLYARNKGPGESAKATLPMFLVGFAVLVVLNSIGPLAEGCDRPRQRRFALVSGRGDRGAWHEDFVQGAVRGRLAADRAHDRGDALDRRARVVCGQSDHLRLVRTSRRLDAALDRKDAFLAERKLAAVDRGVADLADVSVGHDQHDVAASAGRERNQIRVEADRPLRAVAAHLPAGIGPDLGRLAGRNALSGLTEASENVPLRKADHRLLRDLVDFERLARRRASAPTITAQAPRRIFSLLSPGSLPRGRFGRSCRKHERGLTMRGVRSNRRCGARLKDRDLRVAVSPLVDKGEADRRDDLDLRRLLHHAKRIWLKPSSLDERGERRSSQTLSVRRIEEGERKRAAGRRRTELRRVGAPDARHAAERQRLDIGAQKRARLGAVVDEQREPRAARKSLDRERPRSREQVNHARALDLAGESVLENVEDRLAQALRGRTNGARRRRRATCGP